MLKHKRRKYKQLIPKGKLHKTYAKSFNVQLTCYQSGRASSKTRIFTNYLENLWKLIKINFILKQKVYLELISYITRKFILLDNNVHYNIPMKQLYKKTFRKPITISIRILYMNESKLS